MYVELVSEVACGLVPALTLRQKMNTDRERRTGREEQRQEKQKRERERRKNKCQASQTLKPTL